MGNAAPVSFCSLRHATRIGVYCGLSLREDGERGVQLQCPGLDYLSSSLD